MANLKSWATEFNRVGWFIPPYIQMGLLAKLAAEIGSDTAYSQSRLEKALAGFYEPNGLATMVVDRYPISPIIADYLQTISEAIQAHFMGLHHVAVGGLIPVLEGAAKRMAADRKLSSSGMKNLFTMLAVDCKQEAALRQMGDSGEVGDMMDSFAKFASEYVYVDSTRYPLADNTNRHGITHGAYSDADYGSPLNFYKTIAAVDFLTFISSFRANLSWFAPNESQKSRLLAKRYRELQAMAAAV